MNRALSRINRIIEHIKFGNTQFAMLEASDLYKDISEEFGPAVPIAVDSEYFNTVIRLMQLKYGDSKPFCFGLALLLHECGQIEDAQKLFSMSNSEPEKWAVKEA